MVTVLDVPADELITRVKEDLKGETEMPKWAKFVKTGPNRQRPPQQEDWWWIRSAAILRKVYLNGPVGVSRLRTAYGGAKDRGTRPKKTLKAGGKIIREILRQLEDSGYLKTTKKGRKITPKGQKYLDSVAMNVAKEVTEVERKEQGK